MRSCIHAIAAAFALSLVACMPPQMPSDKLTDAAYGIVEAARFGRMDIVLQTVEPTQQEAYADAHSDWGGDIRILDIEYGGARLVAPDKAVVLMTVAWQRLDESILRSTALKQTWTLGGERWAIREEVVAGGDKKLLKEPMPKNDATTPKDEAAKPKVGAAEPSKRGS
ncbi:MAG: hypothetical protein HOW73_28150 [Polyangiaceae bacterium]|nr:hypothetical protein [Polyangiaceae bacterium]